MIFTYFDGNFFNFVIIPRYDASFGYVLLNWCPPRTFNHSNGTWFFYRAFPKHMFYQSTKGLCYADQIRVLNSNGAVLTRNNELRDFSHVGKPHDTLEFLARKHAGLKKYNQWFTESSLQRSKFSGDRLTVVSRKLQSLLVDNTATGGVPGRHRGPNTERITLFDQAYSAQTNHAAYWELLREHKQLVANADRVSLANMAIKDSIKKLEGRIALVCYSDQLSNFNRTFFARLFGY
jgi:hypothetical protein|tara:strand:- start:233 stop:937 length:705 start_codon:yes stop_codon:yes gene_type:complete